MSSSHFVMGVKRTNGMWRCVSRTLLPLLPMTAAVLIGCGGVREPERVVVSGAVTYNGQPLPEGIIHFVPVAGSGMPTTGVAIVAGKYRADAKGGVPVGTHTLQIEAYRRFVAPAQAGAASPPAPGKFELREQYLPEKFNVRSDLQVTIPSGSRAITKDIALSD
jgi:hypothetical protein